MTHTRILILISILISVFSVKSLNAQELELVIQRGHLAPVKKLCFHENNKFLASVDDRNTIIIWDFMLGKEIVRFRDSSEIISMDFLATEDVLVTANKEGQIKYYDIEKNDLSYIIPFEKEINKLMHFHNEILIVGDGMYLVSFTREEIVFISSHNFVDLKFDYNQFKFLGYTFNREVMELDTLFEVKKRGVLSRVNYAKKNLKILDPSLKVRDGLVELNAYDNSFYYFDNKELRNNECFTGKTMHKKGFKIIPNSMATDERGRYLAFGNDQGGAALYDVRKKKIIYTERHIGAVNDIEFSVNGRYFATASEDFSVVIWSTIDGKAIHDLKSRALPIHGLDFDESTKTLYIAQDQNVSTMINMKNKVDLPEKNNHADHVGVVSDIKVIGDRYFTSGFDNNIIIYDKKTNDIISEKNKERESKNILRDKTYGEEFIYSIQPNKNGSRLLVLYGENADGDVKPRMKVVSSDNLNKPIQVIDEFGFDVPDEFKFEGSNYYYIPKFNHDTWGTKNYVGWLGSKDVILASENSFAMFEEQQSELKPSSGIVELYDEVTSVCRPNAKQFFFSMGKALYSMKEYKEENIREINSHMDVITDVIASEQFLFSSSIDGSIKIWDLTMEELIATMIPFADNSMLIFTPDNYYLSINGAHQYVGYKFGSEFIPFENYDLKYNRPDIVLKRLGLSDQTTIDLLKKSYDKRLRKFGFDSNMITDNFYIPEVNIENKDNIPLSVDNSVVNLKLNITDQNENLDRLNLWVNGVPYFGMNGFSLRSSNTRKIDKDLSVVLSKGKNVIEVSAINTSGGESLKRRLEIFSTVEEEEKSLYLITIGVQEFKDPSFNLNYSAKDASNIHDYFAGVNFANAFDFKLLNADFNPKKLSELKTILQGSKPQDQVVLFIATHGLIDADFEYYFATSTTDFNNPSDGGIHKTVLDNILDSIPARNKLVLFDACHSGEIDKEEVEMAQHVEKEENISFRAAGKNIKYNNVNAQKVKELEEILFEDFRKGNGSTVLTSSSGVELSMESEEWNNGLFTYALLNSLKGGINADASLDDLYQAVYKEVQKLSRGKQTPTLRSHNKTANYKLK